MSTQNKIEPDRITKPMQLLAAWLVGLIVVDSTFLITATQMEPESWERGALVVASIANVPLFLFALFLLQTRFRPELQEDAYYSQYLDRRTNQVVTVRADEVVEKEVLAIRNEVRALATRSEASVAEGNEGVKAKANAKVGLNRRLEDFAVLRQKMRAAGIPLDDAFGGDDPPKIRAVAIAGHLPFDERLRFLRLAVEWGFTAYTYFNPAEEDIEQDVLFGSYGAPSYYIKPALATLLNGSPEAVDVRLYEEDNRVPRKPKPKKLQVPASVLAE